MDIRFTVQLNEDGIRKGVRLYYMCHFRVFRYYLIDSALAFVVLVGKPGELYANAIAGVLLVLFLGWGYLVWTFDDYWKNCRKNLMAAKLFGRPANCRITDEYIETEIDGAVLKCVFRNEVAAFYCRHDVLMLFGKDNALLCAFSRSVPSPKAKTSINSPPFSATATTKTVANSR